MRATVIFSDPKQIDSVNLPDNTLLLDENSYKTKRKAKTAKNLVAATLSPCVIVYDDRDNISKVFYREEYQDPISEFNTWYIKNYDKD